MIIAGFANYDLIKPKDKLHGWHMFCSIITNLWMEYNSDTASLPGVEPAGTETRTRMPIFPCVPPSLHSMWKGLSSQDTRFLQEMLWLFLKQPSSE